MRKRMIAAALTVAMQAGAAAADEVEDAMAAALEAYRAGDVATAKAELDFAATLLDQAKADGLKAFLPPVFAGWTRAQGESEALGALFMGGGMTASATYERSGASVEVSLIADNPMVATMGAMLATPSIMALQGEVRRIGRMPYVLTRGGEVMALVDNRIFVQVSGTASAEDKIAYFEAVDFEGLRAF